MTGFDAVNLILVLVDLCLWALKAKSIRIWGISGEAGLDEGKWANMVSQSSIGLGGLIWVKEDGI